MIIAGLWRHGDWRHVATGCNALVWDKTDNVTPVPATPLKVRV